MKQIIECVPNFSEGNDLSIINQITDEIKSDLLVRLRRIEGQVRGIQRMLDSDRECQEILQQLAAVRSAMQNASLIFARRYALQCLHDPELGLDDEQLIDQLVTVLSKA